MHIRLFSDLHLEFLNFDIEPMPEDSESILVLAGDIHVGHRVVPFLDGCAHMFKHVVYVLGNHEYYKGDLDYTLNDIKVATSMIPNIHVLENKTIEVEGIRIIGATMWSSFDGANPLSMLRAAQGMYDYSIISWHDRLITPNDTLQKHRESVQYISEELYKKYDGPTIVVTHHAPSRQCVHPAYATSGINGSFVSDLDALIERFQPDYWFYGHTHQTIHVDIGKTKIRNNPRGYANAKGVENGSFDLEYRVEVASSKIEE